MNRREVLALGGGVAALTALRALPLRAEPVLRHGLSAFDDLKYPADFAQFDYVNAAAPKGGAFSQVPPTTLYNQNFTTFNSLNIFILKGDGAHGLDTTFDSLMARAQDEPDAMYGLLARGVEVSDNGLTYRFHLRPEARFHDGTPIGAEDVAFSFNVLKAQGHPLISQSLHDMVGVEASGDVVMVRFAPGRGRDLPLFVAGLPVFSKAYYTAHAFDQTTLDAPLGSGPYRVARFEQGRFIELERVKDYWGAALPVNRGQNNFDTLRYEYFRDREVAFEGFKGRAYLFREEFTSRVWATGYDFPAIRDGRIKRETIADDTPSGAQGWFINTRRGRFQDARVREALALAFDFEWTNKSLMFGSYKRTASLFQNSDLMATGEPSAEERALLEPFRGQVPEAVFSAPYVPPVSDGSGQDRALLQKADALLNEAGWTRKNGKRQNAQGEHFTIEFLDFEPSFEPHTTAYIRNLERLGIAGSIRRVDPAQYQARVNAFDFDFTTRRYSMSPTPGEALNRMLGSEAAGTAGSNNLPGISDTVVDALLTAVVAADSRPALTTACRALDRVLRAGHYWVPHWYKGSHWLAYWDAFGKPAEKPRYARGAPETWWWDAEKSKKSLG